MAKRIPFNGDERARKELRSTAAKLLADHGKVMKNDASLAVWARQGLKLLVPMIADLEALGDILAPASTNYVRVTGKAPRGMRAPAPELAFLRRLQKALKDLDVKCPRYPMIDARDAVYAILRERGYSREEIATALNTELAALDQSRTRHPKKSLPRGAHGFVLRGKRAKVRSDLDD